MCVFVAGFLISFILEKVIFEDHDATHGHDHITVIEHQSGPEGDLVLSLSFVVSFYLVLCAKLKALCGRSDNDSLQASTEHILLQSSATPDRLRETTEIELDVYPLLTKDEESVDRAKEGELTMLY